VYSGCGSKRRGDAPDAVNARDGVRLRHAGPGHTQAELGRLKLVAVALQLVVHESFVAGMLVIESLKKRRTGIYRAVPVPPALLEALDMREQQASRGKGRGERLWPWSRITGWRAVHTVMAAAKLDGPHALPKGLRHGFGVAAVTADIPLNLVQKWLGHAQLSTTAIYADAVGAEEKDIAQRMWT